MKIVSDSIVQQDKCNIEILLSLAYMYLCLPLTPTLFKCFCLWSNHKSSWKCCWNIIWLPPFGACFSVYHPWIWSYLCSDIQTLWESKIMYNFFLGPNKLRELDCIYRQHIVFITESSSDGLDEICTVLSDLGCSHTQSRWKHRPKIKSLVPFKEWIYVCDKYRVRTGLKSTQI